MTDSETKVRLHAIPVATKSRLTALIEPLAFELASDIKDFEVLLFKDVFGDCVAQGNLASASYSNTGGDSAR